MILSAAMMLRFIGEEQAADRLREAVAGVYAEGKSMTQDLGGSASTDEFAEELVRYITANR